MQTYRLPKIPTVDQVQVESRAAAFTTRSIKKGAKKAALELAIRMMDLTTLEGMDTEVASKLAASGITTRDGLADLAGDELVELTGIDEARAQALIMKARAHWFDTPADAATAATAH